MKNIQIEKFKKKCENLMKSGQKSHPRESDAYIRRSYASRKSVDINKIMKSAYENPKRTSKYNHLLNEPVDSPYRNQEIDAYEVIDRDMDRKLMEEIDKEDLREADLISEADYDAWDNFRADEIKAQQDAEFLKYGEDNELTEQEIDRLFEHISDERRSELWKSFKDAHNI